MHKAVVTVCTALEVFWLLFVAFIAFTFGFAVSGQNGGLRSYLLLTAVVVVTSLTFFFEFGFYVPYKCDFFCSGMGIALIASMYAHNLQVSFLS